MIKIILIALTNCAGNTYKVKEEADVAKGRLLNEVPQWYIDAEIDKGLIKNRDAEDYIYAVGQGTSPDLQLAVEKAIMIAKASLADQLEGEMNKRSELYITEIGQEGDKDVASKVESTIVNIIERTAVVGYEEWNKAVFETPVGSYRVYIGLKYGIMDANKLSEYIAANVAEDVNVDKLAEEAINEVIKAPVEKVEVDNLN